MNNGIILDFSYGLIMVFTLLFSAVGLTSRIRRDYGFDSIWAYLKNCGIWLVILSLLFGRFTFLPPFRVILAVMLLALWVFVCIKYLAHKAHTDISYFSFNLLLAGCVLSWIGALTFLL